MSYPPPDRITNELEDEQCWWAVDNGECPKSAVTTYYDSFRQSWIPVCDDHRGGHFYAHQAQDSGGGQG